MVLNSTSGNEFRIEMYCRRISRYAKKMCTVFVVYDMCRDDKGQYKELTTKQDVVLKKTSADSILARGSGENEEI